mmetsp:Transcript_50034/g.108692  ORF Transcript_50034/g.108692 Transcript_50034/m.108692 type:complete len:322 (-) Transcript_50034:201-1166(-)
MGWVFVTLFAFLAMLLALATRRGRSCFSLPPRVWWRLLPQCMLDVVSNCLAIASLFMLAASTADTLRSGSAILCITTISFPFFIVPGRAKQLWVVGVLFVLGALVTAADVHLFEERGEVSLLGLTLALSSGVLDGKVAVMTKEFWETEEFVEPAALAAIEGAWGTMITLCVTLPVAYTLPGHDHGSLENFNDSILELRAGSSELWLWLFCCIGFGFVSNLTRLWTMRLSFVTAQSLRAVRALVIWGCGLLIHDVSESRHGEQWNFKVFWRKLLVLALIGVAIPALTPTKPTVAENAPRQELAVGHVIYDTLPQAEKSESTA